MKKFVLLAVLFAFVSPAIVLADDLKGLGEKLFADVPAPNRMRAWLYNRIIEDMGGMPAGYIIYPASIKEAIKELPINAIQIEVKFYVALRQKAYLLSALEKLPKQDKMRKTLSKKIDELDDKITEAAKLINQVGGKHLELAGIVGELTFGWAKNNNVVFQQVAVNNVAQNQPAQNQPAQNQPANGNTQDLAEDDAAAQADDDTAVEPNSGNLQRPVNGPILNRPLKGRIVNLPGWVYVSPEQQQVMRQRQWQEQKRACQQQIQEQQRACEQNNQRKNR
jgi:hypothetical protein